MIKLKKSYKPRPRKPEFWVVVCKDGCPHRGFRQSGTFAEAMQHIKGVKGISQTRLDDWGHPCKPHRIKKFVPS